MNLKQKREVAQRFADVRGARSYKQFSKDTHVSTSLLQRYETAGGLPSTENLILLATREKISIDWLLMGDEAME